jgi:hypothetical protein
MCGDNQKWDQLFGDIIWIRTRIHRIETTLGALMSADQEIQAVVTDEQADVATLTSQNTSLTALVAQVLAEIQAGLVQPSTVAALQAVASGVDAQTAAEGVQVADLQAGVNPPASPPVQ